MCLALTSRRAALCVAAQAANRRSATQERVLRYPDGVERRILYPVEPEPESFQKEEELGEPDSTPWWSVDIRPPPEPAFAAVSTAPSTSAPGTEEGAFTFDWDKLKQEAEAFSQRVAATFEVHSNGCPWLLDRRLFVLAVNGQQDATTSFYTLRTRVSREQGVLDELAHVLGSAPLASRMSVSQLEDGVVAFSSRGDASVFADALHGERGGRAEVHILEIKAHELFRFVGDASGLVVAVRSEEGSGWLPEPHQLAGAVRGQAAWDDL